MSTPKGDLLRETSADNITGGRSPGGARVAFSSKEPELADPRPSLPSSLGDEPVAAHSGQASSCDPSSPTSASTLPEGSDDENSKRDSWQRTYRKSWRSSAMAVRIRRLSNPATATEEEKKKEPSGGHMCGILARDNFKKGKQRRASRDTGLVGLVMKVKSLQTLGLQDQMQQEKLLSCLELEMHKYSKQKSGSSASAKGSSFARLAKQLAQYHQQTQNLRILCDCYCMAEKFRYVQNTRPFTKAWDSHEREGGRDTRLKEFWPRFHEDPRTTEAGCGAFPLADFPRVATAAGSDDAGASPLDSSASTPHAGSAVGSRRADKYRTLPGSPLGRSFGPDGWKERAAASRCSRRSPIKSPGTSLRVGEHFATSANSFLATSSSSFKVSRQDSPDLSMGLLDSLAGESGTSWRKRSKRTGSKRGGQPSDRANSPNRSPSRATRRQLHSERELIESTSASSTAGAGLIEGVPKDARDLSDLMMPNHFKAQAALHALRDQKSSSVPVLPRMTPKPSSSISISPSTAGGSRRKAKKSRRDRQGDGYCSLPPAKIKSAFKDPWLGESQSSPHSSVSKESQVRKYLYACQSTGVAPSLMPFATGHSQKLSADGRDLVDDQLQAITAMIKAGSIEAVDLAGSALLSDKVVSEFLEALSHDCDPPIRLELLNLRRCLGVSEMSLASMLRMFGNAFNLRNLDLGSIRMSVRAQLPLSKAIRAHGRLRNVCLSETGMSDSNTSKLCIAELLGSNTIEALDLGWNCFQADVFRRLGELLRGAKVLRTLCLANCSASKSPTEATAPVQHFIEHLARAPYLQGLDLSLNRIDFHSALIIEDALETNSVLKTLDVSDNPLGIHGTRSLLRLLLRNSCGIKYCNWDGCSQGTEVDETTKVFSATNPNGRYSLDLQGPYDRALLRLLYKSCERLGLAHEAAFGEVAATPKYEHAKKVDGHWAVPDQGCLQLTFTIQAATFADVEETDFGRFLDRYYSILCVQPNPQKLLPVLARMCHLSGAAQQQCFLLESLSKDLQLTYPVLRLMCEICSGEASAEIAERLLPSLRGGLLAQHLTMLLMPNVEVAFRVVTRCRSFLTFNPQCPTGHYRLELTSAADFAVLEKLLVLDRWEAGIDQRQKRDDVSQFQDASHMRNCRFKEQPLRDTMREPGPIAKWQLPETGHVEFDYVSSKRPPPDAHPLEMKAFETLLFILRDSDCTAIDQVRALQSICHDIYLQSVQLRELVGALDSAKARENCAVMFYHRLVDPHNDKLFRARMEGDMDRIASRLGFLSVLPWMQPEQATLNLDCRHYDERLAFSVLTFVLAEKENPKNCQQISFCYPDGTLDSFSKGVPRMWMFEKEMPRNGGLQVSYICSAEESSFSTREKLFRKYGYWSTEFNQQDIRWWSYLSKVPQDVIAYAKWLANHPEYTHSFQVFHDIVGAGGGQQIGRERFDAAFKELKCDIFQGKDGVNEAQGRECIFRYLDQNGNGNITRGEWARLEQIVREVRLAVNDFFQHTRRAFEGDLQEAWCFLRPNGEPFIDEDTWTTALNQPNGYFGPAKLVFFWLAKIQHPCQQPTLLNRDDFLAMELDRIPVERILDFSAGLEASKLK